MILKPIVGISMGDPAGIGPEITVKALGDPGNYSASLLFLKDCDKDNAFII